MTNNIESLQDHNVYAQLRELVALRVQAAGFSFLPRQAMQSILAGRHASKLRGRGLNFEELRHYRTGDDIRTLDWKVTNRTKKPHVRVYTEERERNVLLLVDQRIAMFFGSQLKMKSVIAAEMAALSAWRTLGVGDRVGALVFNDQQISVVKPQRSSKAVMHILHQVIGMNHQLKVGGDISLNGAQLNTALQEAEQLCGHDYLVVVISDMAGHDAETIKRIKRLTRHNDVIVSLIYDPLEKNLATNDQLIVSDGVLQIAVNTNKKRLKQKFKSVFKNVVVDLKKELNAYGVPVLPINTVDPVAQQVRQALGKEGR